jgi:hypothetical protein
MPRRACRELFAMAESLLQAVLRLDSDLAAKATKNDLARGLVQKADLQEVARLIAARARCPCQDELPALQKALAQSQSSPSKDRKLNFIEERLQDISARLEQGLQGIMQVPETDRQIILTNQQLK